jgi:uncharacterized peroxidase-related enzyme
MSERRNQRDNRRKSREIDPAENPLREARFGIEVADAGGIHMFLAMPESSEATERIYKASADSQGFVMNLTKVWAWRPDIYEAFASLRTQLTSKSSLTKRDQAVLVCATAAQLGDSYCSLAWGRTLTAETGPAATAAVLAARETSELTGRDQALAAWARKVVADPNATNESDIASLRAAGFGDREIFEITAFIAFRLAFSSINDALGAVPDRELVSGIPEEVVAVVTYGRRPGTALAADGTA